MTPEQKEYLATVEALRRWAVSDVTESRSSTLTDKNRARMKKVSEDLAAGRNPYYDPNNESDVNKGGDVPESVKVKDRVLVVDKPHQEIAYRSNKGAAVFGPESDVESIFGFELPTPPKAPPEHTFCDFCGVATPNNKITKGTLKPRKIMSLDGPHEDLVTGRSSFEWKVLHTVDKVAACPNCVLNIKPVLDKHGDIISQGVQFRPSEG